MITELLHDVPHETLRLARRLEEPLVDERARRTAEEVTGRRE